MNIQASSNVVITFPLLMSAIVSHPMGIAKKRKFTHS